ncbi:MAG: NAD-dependent epimerase/dehydratase family protein [Acidimicrobiia bacterium]|jgi:UDP-glucose 4-epimerase
MSWRDLDGRVVVVGSGFLGLAIAGHLARSGAEATLVHRSPLHDAARAAAVGCRLVHGDARLPQVARAAVADARHVVWCAGGLMPAEAEVDPLGAVEAALGPVLGFLGALHTREIADFTFVSSGGTVYGGAHTHPIAETTVPEPQTAYGIANLTTEGFVRRSCAQLGVRPLILRCGNIYGPGQPGNRSQGLVAAALAAVVDGESIRMFGAGDAVRDYLYVDDFAHAVSRLVGREQAHEVFNVGSGTGASVRDVISTVESVTGRPLRVDHQPARACDVPFVVLDTARLRSVVPNEPRSLDDGIRATWSAMPLAARSAPS